MRDGKKARGGRRQSGRQADAARQDARKQGGRRAGGRQREALKPDARELEARRAGALASAAQAGAEAEQADELLKMEILMRKDRNKVRRKYALMVFALFVFASALIYRYTYVIELSGMISRQNATLAKIDGENSVLQKQISMETDLEKIRLLAESRLNMHKPEKHQIIYISVPKRDHAMLEIGQESDERRPLLDRLAEQIQFIRERLFIK